MDATRLAFPSQDMGPFQQQSDRYPLASNAEAGPSSGKKAQPPKRKRLYSASTATPPPDAPQPPQPIGAMEQTSQVKGTKKKKASRACASCQKAHLTCDDSRPCQRCVKRGMADSCVEGHRKKAKYLLDEEELEALNKKKHRTPDGSGVDEADPESSIPSNQLFNNNLSDPDSLFNLAFDPTYQFGSQTANLEYSILSAILGNPSPEAQPPDGLSPLQTPSNTWPSTTISGQLTPSPENVPPAYAPLPPEPQRAQPSPSNLAMQTATSSFIKSLGPPSPPPSNGSPDVLNESPAITYAPADYNNNAQPPDFQVNGNAPAAQINRSSASMTAGDTVYSSVSAPYDYTQGYHFLMHFLSERSASPFLPPLPNSRRFSVEPLGSTAATASSGADNRPIFPVSFSSIFSPSVPVSMPPQAGPGLPPPNTSSSPSGGAFDTGVDERMMRSRFEKNDILRVVRALAIFRPSLIALQMPMTEQDETFVEKALQRSLLELEKLISFSGTPTAIWRRTGEICVVGLEFTMLTGWSKEELIGSRKFIYELFENQSVVEYWENFASHAFENSTQSVYSHCVLLKPSGEPVSCAFCFTIRRDMFDLPNLIIGQWLPLF